MHIDLHETTDTDKTVFREMTAARDGDVEFTNTAIDDGFYVIGDGEKVSIGDPVIAGASVKAEIVSHGRDKKIRVFKMKRRKKYRRTQGHRQSFTQLRVTEITS